MKAKQAELATSRPIPEPMMGLDDIAAALAVGRRTVDRMRSTGKLPKADLHIGNLLRWHAATIRTWIEQQVESN